MKKFVSLIFAGCLIVAMQTSCKYEELHKEPYCITKYIFQNDTELPVTITFYEVVTPETDKTIPILIEPGKEWINSYESPGFRLPFFPYYKIVVNNTEVDVECRCAPYMNESNLFNRDIYTITLDEQYERHYLFVFTDDFFAEIESEK